MSYLESRIEAVGVSHVKSNDFTCDHECDNFRGEDMYGLVVCGMSEQHLCLEAKQFQDSINLLLDQ